MKMIQVSLGERLLKELLPHIHSVVLMFFFFFLMDTQILLWVFKKSALGTGMESKLRIGVAVLNLQIIDF